MSHVMCIYIKYFIGGIIQTYIYCCVCGYDILISRYNMSRYLAVTTAAFIVAVCMIYAEAAPFECAPTYDPQYDYKPNCAHCSGLFPTRVFEYNAVSDSCVTIREQSVFEATMLKSYAEIDWLYDTTIHGDDHENTIDYRRRLLARIVIQARNLTRSALELSTTKRIELVTELFGDATNNHTGYLPIPRSFIQTVQSMPNVDRIPQVGCVLNNYTLFDEVARSYVDVRTVHLSAQQTICRLAERYTDAGSFSFKGPGVMLVNCNTGLIGETMQTQLSIANEAARDIASALADPYTCPTIVPLNTPDREIAFVESINSAIRGAYSSTQVGARDYMSLQNNGDSNPQNAAVNACSMRMETKLHFAVAPAESPSVYMDTLQYDDLLFPLSAHLTHASSERILKWVLAIEQATTTTCVDDHNDETPIYVCINTGARMSGISAEEGTSYEGIMQAALTSFGTALPSQQVLHVDDTQVGTEAVASFDIGRNVVVDRGMFNVGIPAQDETYLWVIEHGMNNRKVASLQRNALRCTNYDSVIIVDETVQLTSDTDTELAVCGPSESVSTIASFVDSTENTHKRHVYSEIEFNRRVTENAQSTSENIEWYTIGVPATYKPAAVNEWMVTPGLVVRALDVQHPAARVSLTIARDTYRPFDLKMQVSCAVLARRVLSIQLTSECGAVTRDVEILDDSVPRMIDIMPVGLPIFVQLPTDALETIFVESARANSNNADLLPLDAVTPSDVHDAIMRIAQRKIDNNAVAAISELANRTLVPAVITIDMQSSTMTPTRDEITCARFLGSESISAATGYAPVIVFNAVDICGQRTVFSWRPRVVLVNTQNGVVMPRKPLIALSNYYFCALIPSTARGIIVTNAHLLAMIRAQSYVDTTDAWFGQSTVRTPYDEVAQYEYTIAAPSTAGLSRKVYTMNATVSVQCNIQERVNITIAIGRMADNTDTLTSWCQLAYAQGAWAMFPLYAAPTNTATPVLAGFPAMVPRAADARRVAAVHGIGAPQTQTETSRLKPIRPL